MKNRIKNCTHHDSKVVQKLAAGGMAGSRNSDKSGPAGPSKDSSGRNASSASSKGAFGGGGGLGGGGNKSGGNAGKTNKGGGLGLTTGKTIHGNTAFGPAGGMAQGYATSKGGTGMGPSNKSFSNFKNLDGSPMYGNMGNRSVTARNANQANGMMNALSRAQAPRPKARPSATVVPASAPPPKPRAKPKVGMGPKIPFDATLDKFKGWWHDKIATGPIPTRPRPKPGANRWGGKANGPLGEGWDEKAPGNRKRDHSLGAGWDERVPKEDK